MKHFIALILLACCSGPPGANPTPRPEQDRAVAIVWNQVLRMDHMAPPAIRWVEADELDCNGDTGWSEGKLCVYGVGWPHEVLVAWPRGARFSTTEFAHELLHRALGGDPDHLTHHWRPGGRLDVSVRELEAAGL